MPRVASEAYGWWSYVIAFLFSRGSFFARKRAGETKEKLAARSFGYLVAMLFLIGIVFLVLISTRTDEGTLLAALLALAAAWPLLALLVGVVVLALPFVAVLGVFRDNVGPVILMEQARTLFLSIALGMFVLLLIGAFPFNGWMIPIILLGMIYGLSRAVGGKLASYTLTGAAVVVVFNIVAGGALTQGTFAWFLESRDHLGMSVKCDTEAHKNDPGCDAVRAENRAMQTPAPAQQQRRAVVETVNLPTDGRRLPVRISSGDWDDQTTVCLTSRAHTIARDIPVGTKVHLRQWGNSGEVVHEGTVEVGQVVYWKVISGSPIQNYACEMMRRADGGAPFVIDHWAVIPRDA